MINRTCCQLTNNTPHHGHMGRLTIVLHHYRVSVQPYRRRRTGVLFFFFSTSNQGTFFGTRFCAELPTGSRTESYLFDTVAGVQSTYSRLHTEYILHGPNFGFLTVQNRTKWPMRCCTEDIVGLGLRRPSGILYTVLS